jgi:hypothetical protein
MAGRNTLAAETRAGLARLAGDVAVKQFGQSRDAAVDELLSAFANASRRVRVVFADVDRSPQEARSYGVMRDGTVVVAAGGRWRKVEKPTEPALFQAIVQVTADREPAVCFTTGQGERGTEDQGAPGTSQWSTALKAAGYRVARVPLLQDVPPECEVLFVAGPSASLAPDALSRLDAYLGRGGRVALLVDPPVADGLRSWLAIRGIEAGDGVIVETNPAGRQVGAGPESPLALAYFDHPITRGFELASIFDRAVPLNVRRPAQVGLPVPVAGTGDRAFERRSPAVESTDFREGVDRRGPFLLAVASTMPRGLTDDQNVQEGRLVVFGDSDVITNAYLNRQGNRDLALRVVAWLAGEEEARSVSLGDRQNRRTSLTERTRTWMYVVNLGLLPLLPLAAWLALRAAGGVRTRIRRAPSPSTNRRR